MPLPTLPSEVLEDIFRIAAEFENPEVKTITRLPAKENPPEMDRFKFHPNKGRVGIEDPRAPLGGKLPDSATDVLVGDTAYLVSDGEYCPSPHDHDTRSEEKSSGTLPQHSPLVRKFISLQNDLERRQKVRNVVLNTCSVFEYHRRNEDRLSEHWHNAVLGICKFPNLSAVRVNFDVNCSDGVNKYANLRASPPQSIGFRTEVLRSLFEALNDGAHPTPFLKVLDLNHLQNLTAPEILGSAAFKNVLLRVEKLYLDIATEKFRTGREEEVEVPQLHSFFRNELPCSWLEPVSQNLTQLTLFVDTYWGWCPSFDMRGTRFPLLKYLSLYNYTFANDWQIDWLASFAPALEILQLHDCPLVFYLTPKSACNEVEELCQDDHIQTFAGKLREGDFDRKEGHWIYNSRWHHFCPKLEAGLPFLRRLSVKNYTYVTFDGGVGPSPWMEPDKFASKKRDSISEYLEYEENEFFEYMDGVPVYHPAAHEPPFRYVPEQIYNSKDFCPTPLALSTVDLDETDERWSGCGEKDKRAFQNLQRTMVRRAWARAMGKSAP